MLESEVKKLRESVDVLNDNFEKLTGLLTDLQPEGATKAPPTEKSKTVAPKVQPAPEPQKEQSTIADVRKVLSAMPREDAKALLAEFDAKKLSELAVESFSDLIKRGTA